MLHEEMGPLVEDRDNLGANSRSFHLGELCSGLIGTDRAVDDMTRGHSGSLSIELLSDARPRRPVVVAFCAAQRRRHVWPRRAAMRNNGGAMSEDRYPI